MVKFYDYVEEYYVGKNEIQETVRGKNKKMVTVFKPLLFKVDLWSVYSRVNECIPRTNNFCEAWHNAFGVIYLFYSLIKFYFCFYFKSMLNKHPLIYSLIDSFRTEDKKMQDLHVQLKTGFVYKRKPKYVQLDDRIKEVLKFYEEDDFFLFYDNLAAILNY